MIVPVTKKGMKQQFSSCTELGWHRASVHIRHLSTPTRSQEQSESVEPERVLFFVGTCHTVAARKMRSWCDFLDALKRATGNAHRRLDPSRVNAYEHGKQKVLGTTYGVPVRQVVTVTVRPLGILATGPTINTNIEDLIKTCLGEGTDPSDKSRLPAIRDP